MTQNIRLFTIVAALSLCGCWPVMTARVSQPIEHVVVCWLKSPGDPCARQELITASESFVGKIPGLTRVAVGPSASLDTSLSRFELRCRGSDDVRGRLRLGSVQ